MKKGSRYATVTTIAVVQVFRVATTVVDRAVLPTPTVSMWVVQPKLFVEDHTWVVLDTLTAYRCVLIADQAPSMFLEAGHANWGRHRSPCSVTPRESRIELLVRLRQMLPWFLVEHDSVRVLTLLRLGWFWVDRVVDLRLVVLQLAHPLGSGICHCIERCRPSRGRRLGQCLSQQG